MSLRPMTKANEKPSLKPSSKQGGIKLGTSIKTATVEQLNLNFVTWKDLENSQSIVFELTDGEFIHTQSEQNKNWKFENFYTWKVVIVDADENVVRVIEAQDSDNLIQIPCQQSHRQGIKELIEMGEKVCIFKDLKVNTVNGTSYYNCNVGSLALDSLEEFKA